MTAELRLPELSSPDSRATLVKWHVAVGSRVNAGDLIAEVESDKAVVELEADAPGIVQALLVEEGASEITPGQTLAVLGPSGPMPAPRLDDDPRLAAPSRPPNPGTPTETEASLDRPTPAAEPTASIPPADRVNASLLAVQMARQIGWSLDDVAGTGDGGRVLARDVETQLSAGARDDIPMRPSQLAVPPPPPQIASTSPPMPANATYETECLGPMRSAMAAKVASSKRDIPHFYLSITCGAAGLASWREALASTASTGRPAPSPSLNDLILKIVAETLVRRPELNSGWIDSNIRRYRTVDLSVAMATEHGLCTPVIRDAGGASVLAIASEMRRLTELGTSGRLQPHDLAGGTFLVSNLGMYGIDQFSAVISPPQAAALAIGAIREAPVALDGVVSAAQCMMCTLSVDHRVADGAAAAEFLAELRRLIEDPRLLVV